MGKINFGEIGFDTWNFASIIVGNQAKITCQNLGASTAWQEALERVPPL